MSMAVLTQKAAARLDADVRRVCGPELRLGAYCVHG
jgi:hypothetical protein